MFTRRRTLIAALKENGVLVALPCFAILSTLWSSNPFETVHRGAFILLSTIFALYLSRRLTPEQHLQLFYYVGVCAAVLSLLCVATLPAYGIGPDGACKGIFGHKNDLGVFMVFLASPALHLPKQRGLAKVVRICFLLLTLVLIAFSQSRSGWLVAIAYAAFFFGSTLLRRFHRRSRSILLLASVVLTVTFGSFVYENYAAFLELIGKDATLSDRTEIWKAVMASILKKPLLGYGYGAFWQGLLGPSADVIISIHFGIGHAHNGFLNVWLEMGAAGLALVVFVFVRAGRQCLRLSDWSDSIRWYMGVLFLVLVSNFDESFLFNTNDLIWMLFILAAAQIASLYRSERFERGRRQLIPALQPRGLEAPALQSWPL
jgi:O-antigen ligase